MAFKSAKELENYILSHSEVAIKAAQEKVYGIINKFLEQYYNEYEPSLYERTGQLLRSLVKSDVRQNGSGLIAEVYFDLNLLDYSIKTLKGIGTWDNKGWSEEVTLQTAMIGENPHGGWPTNNKTQIWTESMKVLNQDAIEILKQELVNAGIPVR